MPESANDGGVAGYPSIFLMPISHPVLASLRNRTPESLSRVLHELSSSNLITVQGRHVRIHGVQRLREFDL